MTRSPDGIRTRATALRGRRARPLHNGALAGTRPYPDSVVATESVGPPRELIDPLGYQDSNLEQLNQNQPCCQLHHTPWGYQSDRAAIVLTTTWFLQNRPRTLHARRWGI